MSEEQDGFVKRPEWFARPRQKNRALYDRLMKTAQNGLAIKVTMREYNSAQSHFRVLSGFRLRQARMNGEIIVWLQKHDDIQQ